MRPPCKQQFFLSAAVMVVTITAALFFCPLFSPSTFAAPPEDEAANNDLINAYRAGKPPNVDTRAEIVKMLIEVKDGKMDAETFYKKVSKLKIPEGQELRHTLMEVKKDVGNYLGENGLKRVFGNLTPSGGSDVEAKILTHRKEVVMETIHQAIQIYAKTNPKFSMYYGEVGGWPTETPEQMKFAGDIDFNFLSGDLKSAMELKKIFDDLIVKRYGRAPEHLDIPCTVHGMATGEVYVGKHGQAFAESVTSKLWPINFDPSKGPIGVVPRDQEVKFEEARLRMILEAELHKSANALDDLASLKWPNQPGISLEMIRHFEHDIVGKNVYTDLESFVKAAKYAERSFNFLAKDLGEDAIKDKLLRQLTTDLTTHKKDPKKQVDLIKAYFEATGKPLPFEVDLSINKDGKKVATIKANEAVIREFWNLCRKTMWESANVKIKKLVSDLGQRIASLDDTDAAGAKAIYDELSKYHEMLEIEDLILRDKHAGVHEHLDGEYQKIIIEFRDMVKAFKQKIAKNGLLKYIDPQTGKTYAWVEEMLKGDNEFNIKMAGAAIMALPGKVNNFLDFMDDGLLNKFRNGTGGDEYIRILRNGQGYYWGEQVDQFLKGTRFEGRFTNQFNQMEVSLDAQLQKTTDWLNSHLESKLTARGIKLVQGGVGAIQTVNTTFNNSVANSSAGQATMAALMIYNLKDELPIYYRLLEQGDWEGLGAEFFKRRVPFGSAVERGVMGDYYGVAWEVTATLVPPTALFRVAATLGEYLATTGFETFFDEEMDTFIDSLYEGAKFRVAGVETVGEDIKISKWELISVTYSGKTYDYNELIDLEREGAREMADCLRKPSDQRVECFPMEKIRDGLFEWFRSEDAFRHQFKKTDSWIQLIDEMEKEPHVGQKLKDYFRYQKYARLERIKVDFLRRTKEKLEERRSGEQASLSGELPKMFDELMKTADDLDMRVQLEAEIDEKFGGEVVRFFTWMKDYLRGTYRYLKGDVDVWDIYEELSAFITENLSVYKKIQESRDKTEETFLTLNKEDQGLRLLKGPYFLKGKSEEDESTSTKWIELSEQVKEDMTDKLTAIKIEEEAEPAELDLKEDSYDLDMLNRLIYHDSFKEMWKQVNSTFTDLKIPSYLGNNPSWQSVPNTTEGAINDQDRALQRYGFHQQRVEQLLKEFREHYQALIKNKDSGLAAMLTKLEGLLATALSLEKQANDASTNLTNAAKTLEKDLKSLQDELKKLSTEVDKLKAKLTEQTPDVGAIRDDQFLLDQKGEELAELSHTIENDTLSTCEIYKQMEGIDDIQALANLVGQAKDHWADVNGGYENYKSIQNDIDAAQKRVEAERKKTGGAEKILKRYESSLTSLQSRMEGVRAQLTNIQKLATTIQGFETNAGGIVAEAIKLVEEATPKEGKNFSKEGQKIFNQMEKVLEEIKVAQANIIKTAKSAGSKKDALASSLKSIESMLKEIQSNIDGYKQEFTGESHKEQLKQALADFQATVDAAGIFIDPINTAKKSAKVCMDGIQYEYDKKKTPEALTTALDCSKFPNTRAQWNESHQEAECVCFPGFEWNTTSDGCVEVSGVQTEDNQVDCSPWPNTEPIWDASLLQYLCACVNGMKWDQNQGRCVSAQQPPADCSQWPGTQPQWNAATQQYDCICANGTQWDQYQGRCVTPQQIQADCSQWPGTQSQWNASTQQFDCICANGTQWDQWQGRCIAPQQVQADCSQWPGTQPIQNAYGMMECACPGNTYWSNGQGKCISDGTQQEGTQGQGDCAQWPGTVAQWDNFGGYNCVCPNGTQWNPGESRCVSTTNQGSQTGQGTTTQQQPTGGSTGSSGTGTGSGTSTGTGTTGTGSGGTGTTTPPTGGGGGGFGGGQRCPDGSISILGVCGATGGGF